MKSPTEKLAEAQERVAKSGFPEGAVCYKPGNEAACREALDKIVAADERTYMYGDALVILRVPKIGEGMRWAPDLPGTTPAMTADIIERAERLKWVARSGGKKSAEGDEEKPRWRRMKPPRDFCADYLIQRKHEYGARVLLGIARVPYMHDDGKIDRTVGYNAATGIFCDRMPIVDVPDEPTLDDAKAAAEKLLAPFQHYKPALDTATFSALVLAAIFTAIERPFMQTAPLFAINGAQAGTGKGELVHAVSFLAIDAAAPAMTYGHSEEEFGKRFDAMMLSSPPVFCIDNANGKTLQNAGMESLITEGTATIRQFGTLRNAVVRARTMIFVNGNHLTISGDMFRRTIVIGILPRSASPETEVFPFTPSGYVAQHREALLSAAYTAMRAFRLAGMPKTPGSTVASFPEWERRVRDLVYWLTGYDLAREFDRNKEEDPARRERIEFLAALHNLYGREQGWFVTKQLVEIAANYSSPPAESHAAIRGYLTAAIDGPVMNRGVVGVLRSFKDAWQGEYLLREVPDRERGSRWQVQHQPRVVSPDAVIQDLLR